MAAAVHADGLARDEVAVDERDDGFRDLLAAAPPAQGRGLLDRLVLVGLEIGRGEDRPGGDGVHSHIRGPEFAGRGTFMNDPAQFDHLASLARSGRLLALRADMLALGFVVDVVTVLWALPVGTRASRGVPITRLAVAGDAAVAGEVVTGILTMDIPDSVITVWVTIIHLTGITVIHITDPIPIRTATGTGPMGA